MCGFAGFIEPQKKSGFDVLNAMSESLQHRGPDDSGNEIIDHTYATIGLGFRRLAIIDLSSTGHQPMSLPDKSVHIMMNGEIYNYQEIKLELQTLGCSFISSSDTEVVLQAYNSWGINMIDRLIGMFAIFIFDSLKDCTYLIRDRAGVKPLFWYRSPDGDLLFASELKAFHKHPSFVKELNNDSLSLYLMNGSIPAPYTIFSNAFKVEPGTWVRVDLKTNKLEKHVYWNAFDAYNKPVLEISFNEAKVETEKLMQSAFNYRMVADVPVGVFLSGGYDSTAVAALLGNSVSNLNTYTIGFNETAYDESKHAKEVASHLGTNHHEYTCDFKEATEIIPELPFVFDEPFGDPSAIPTILVSKVAREHVTVALSADAGDELFAGYPRHKKVLNYLNKFESIPQFVKSTSSIPTKIIDSLFNPSIGRADRINKLTELLNSKGVMSSFNAINKTYTEKEIKRLLTKKFFVPKTIFDQDSDLSKNVSILSKILAVEYKTYLADDILQKVDRATMSVSLEGREPFLDHRLLEYVATLPDVFKLNNGTSKYILKEIVHDYVPQKMMDRPKMGFGVPVDRWMRHELRELFEEVLSLKKIEEQGVFNVDEIRRLKDAYLKNEITDVYRIWYIFVFQLWYNKWMN